MSRLSHEDDKFLGRLVREKKTQENLVTSHQVTQDPDDTEKGDTFVSSIEGSKKKQQHV